MSGKRSMEWRSGEQERTGFLQLLLGQVEGSHVRCDHGRLDALLPHELAGLHELCSE